MKARNAGLFSRSRAMSWPLRTSSAHGSAFPSQYRATSASENSCSLTCVPSVALLGERAPVDEELAPGHVGGLVRGEIEHGAQDRKSTRLNSSHRCISYA